MAVRRSRSVSVVVVWCGAVLLLSGCGPSLSRSQALEVIDRSLAWVPIAGGEFSMGCREGDVACCQSERPRHMVRLPGFEMSRTEVTLAAYRACVQAGACSKPVGDAPACLWDKTGLDELPINCVSYEQAWDFARFVGARLPSEAEWEYAARSGGRDQPYPWGHDAPTCRLAAVTDRRPGAACPDPALLRPGSRPLGDSARGVSDLVGNVAEWVADCFDGDYEHAAADGSPILHPHYEEDAGVCYEPSDFVLSRRRVECPADPDKEPPPCEFGLIRGGSFVSEAAGADDLRVTQRIVQDREGGDVAVGIRLVRSGTSRARSD